MIGWVIRMILKLRAKQQLIVIILRIRKLKLEKVLNRKCVPSTRKTISSYDVVFYESFSSALAYTSRTYSEAIPVRPAVTYTPYVTSSKEQAGNVITFAQFEEGNILTETRNDAESGDKSDNKSIMMSEQDMENLDYSVESDHDLISTDMLQDICDGSQTHPNVNKREARYKIRDRISQGQL